ncbi:serine hydrolase domain-containing protein [Larkinella sp.]|uniref:serine hydrolase domain-containing protein n=1 Tax=Larkinella sp. TaxID=2034517 RepID=UPI003BAB1307
MLVPTFSIGIRAHLLLLLSGWYTTTQAQSNLSEKIRQIENHLLPAIVVEGEEVEPLNMADRMKQLRIPGLSIAVIKDGEIEWVKGYGFASQEEQRAVNENTMFQAASISKPLTALATLHWVEKGMFSLDTNINAYLKNWQVPDTKYTTTEKATLRRIMSHTAGLTVHGFRGYAANEEIPSLIQILKGEKPANSPAVLPDTVPGRIFRYSGGGYTVLQKALVDQLKKPFPTLMHETVLSKLGMHHSSYEQPLAERFRTLAATGYQSNGKALKDRYHTYPEMAAAGLWTTPSDLARYIIDIQQSLQGKSNRLISKSMAEQMLTKNLDWYGLGPMMQNEGDLLLFIHGGSNKGFRSLYVAQANHGNGVVIMTNSDNGFTIIYDLMRSISNVYGWNFYRPMSVKKFTLNPGQISRIVGKYDMTHYSFEMIQTNGKMYLKPNWDEPAVEMIAESREVMIDRDGQHRLELLYDDAHTVVGAHIFGDAFKKMK